MSAPLASRPRIIAAISDSEDLRRVFRARAEELNLSRNTLDEIAGLPAGYCAKLLADPPVRDIGPTSLWPLLGALGLAFAAIEDEAAMVRTRKAPKRKMRWNWGMNWRNVGANAKALALLSQWGRNGAEIALSHMTAEQRSIRSSKAAKARWRKVRKAARVATIARAAAVPQAQAPAPRQRSAGNGARKSRAQPR